MKKEFNYGLADIKAMLANLPIASTLGWQDIQLRYRRSKIGPFWITISSGIMIMMIGLIFGQALGNPMDEYLPYLSVGIIFWGYISTSINEGCMAFIESAGMIRQLSIPLSIYPTKVIYRNIVILGHNIILIPLVLLWTDTTLTLRVFLILPGFILLAINIFWLSVVLGVLCTRFRDMTTIVTNILQVFFYLTPIIWQPNSLSPRTSSLLVNPNPFYHLLEIVRAPILGEIPAMLSWQVSFSLAILGMVFLFFFFGKFKDRIAYWV